MHFESLVVRTGVPIPPPSGPARLRHCLAEGHVALESGRLAYKAAFRSLAVVTPDVIAAAPPTFGLIEHVPRWLGSGSNRRRVSVWFGLARKLRDERVTLRAQRLGFLDNTLIGVESDLRSALQSTCVAFRWFSDAALDTAGGEYGAEARDTILRLVEEAHRLSHEIGDLVGGLFGCRYKHQDGLWFDRCELSLMHVRMGVSAGFTATLRCSICRGDASECEHINGRHYTVSVQRGIDADRCDACSEACAHEDGGAYRFIAGTTFDDIDLREVSLVERPRDPLARLTGREVDPEHLRADLGRNPEAWEHILHVGCIGRCEGIRVRSSDDEWTCATDARMP